jgi:hypothetical protein
MSFHDSPFRVVQWALLVQDRIGNPQLSDVVEQTSACKYALLGYRHPQLAANPHTQVCDSPIVALRLAILDFNCRDQSSDDIDIQLFGID